MPAIKEDGTYKTKGGAFIQFRKGHVLPEDQLTSLKKVGDWETAKPDDGDGPEIATAPALETKVVTPAKPGRETAAQKKAREEAEAAAKAQAEADEKARLEAEAAAATAAENGGAS